MAKKKAAKDNKANGGRRRGPKAYPVVPFSDALKIAEGIIEHAAGETVRRLRLLKLLDLKPTAQSTRDTITNSGKYGITNGSHAADELSLTEEGKSVVDPSLSPRVRRQAAFDLAIGRIDVFKKLYDLYAGKTMPALEVMQDALADIDLGDRKPCVDVFVGNAKHLGLLKTIGGSQQLLKIEDALDDLARESPEVPKPAATVDRGNQAVVEPTDYSRICFFITPIGDLKSDDAESRKHRRHSDTVLEQYVRRAIDEQELTVIRADEIAESGMISKQIAEYVVRSALVVADLSFSNPNVFYELCLRHVTGRPTVHLIQRGDKIPFDVGNFRTITIGLDDVHEAIAEIDTHRAEIANFVRQAMAAGETKDNPILSYFPNAKFDEGVRSS